MEGERKRPKGGFFHLFDWNGKSRKKLFANNSEFPEGLKQEKENVEHPAKLQAQVVDEDDRRANVGNRGNTDLSCASSVVSDEGYGARVPGVVARLMGLDSLPTSSAAETASTPFFESNLLKVSQYSKSNPSFGSGDNHIGHLNVPNNQENLPCTTLEPRTAKTGNRPIKRFQTEILPPKSAKSIPVTQHKLLSPVKNHGFIQEKKVAYIVEAAAKIIEASPKAASKNKVPSIGSSSVPLQIRDLKKKMEAAHTVSRPQRSETPAPTNARGQLIEKSLSGSEGTSSSRTSMFSEKITSSSLKNKGKLIPLAVQPTTNARRKEGYLLRSDNITKQKDQLRVKSNQSGGKMTAQQRNSEKTNNVLRPNNQKQNFVSNRDGSTLKNSVPNQEGSKVQSAKSSVGPSRTLNKVVVKPETTSRKVDSEKQRTKSISRKRQTVNGDLHGDGAVSSAAPPDKNDGVMKGVVTIDGCMNANADNKKNGTDIVSFTFMSPIKKETSSSPPYSQMRENFNAYTIVHSSNSDHPHMKSGTPYFPGLAAIGGDALSILLEQKLKELTTKIDPSHCNVIKEGPYTSPISRLPHTVCKLDPCLTTSPVARDSMAQVVTKESKSGAQHHNDFNSVEYLRLPNNQKWKQSEEMEAHSSSSSNGSESGKEMESRHPSSVSILEPSLTCESLSDTNDSKVFDGISTAESLEVEYESELSDSASSICNTDVVRKHIIVTSTMTESREPSHWELHYTRDVINNAELHLQEFVLGQTGNVISPHLFDQLENQDNAVEKNGEDHSKLGRKLLFDCVSERLGDMCGQVFIGSCKSWAKLETLSQRKGWLAVEICKEILCWNSMGDLMVDELVDKDMSTQYGKWLDFSIEAFEEGTEIEKVILTCLIDELVHDLLM